MMTMSFMIPARSVQLEAVLREPAKGSPSGAVVFCHPHPAFGGTMDNRVIYRAAKAATEIGFASLRFNFRGVGESTGEFDKGIGEKEDVLSVIDWLEIKYPDIPLALVGYSFGAWVGLQTGCADSRVKTLVGLAVPLSIYDHAFLIENPKPALYISGTRDEFCPRESLDRLTRLLPPASRVYRIEGADHFFSHQLDKVENLIMDFFTKH